MSDEDPTASERAEAEALAEALELGSPHPPLRTSPQRVPGSEAPADALEVAGLLRYARPSAVLAPERGAALLDRVLSEVEESPDGARPIAHPPKRGVVRLLPWVGVAVAAAAAFLMLRPTDRAAPVGASTHPIVATTPAPAVEPEPRAAEPAPRPPERVAGLESARPSTTLGARSTLEPGTSTEVGAKAEAEAAKAGLPPKGLARVLEETKAAPGATPDLPVNVEGSRNASNAPARLRELLSAAPAHWPVPSPQLLAAQSSLGTAVSWHHDALDRELSAYRLGVLNAIAARQPEHSKSSTAPSRSP